MTHSESKTWAELVRAVAADHGITDLPDVAVEFLLQEHTAWPWTPADYVERQLEKLFTKFNKERILSDLPRAVALPATPEALKEVYG